MSVFMSYFHVSQIVLYLTVSKYFHLAMRALELKIPPPVVGLALAALMWWISTVTPALDTPKVIRITGAVVIAAIGGALDTSGLVAFLRSKTTVNPLRPEKTAVLVTGGAYRITRNPMYVGMLLLLVAWAVYLAAPWAAAGPLLFFAWIDRFQIAPEERVMAAKFGAEFEAYRRRVRRWL
jgi:protein-S-isoprenylcysteine O-methyltransferase Ste14